MAILIILSLKGEEIWTLLGASRLLPSFELKVIKIDSHNRHICSGDFPRVLMSYSMPAPKALPASRTEITFAFFKLVE